MISIIPAGVVVPIFFDAFAGATGASLTISNFAVGDVLIYKGTSMTQRSSTAGFTLIDTDGIDLDGTTGIHGVSIDLSDNTDAGFYAVGSFYTVVIGPITVDGQTINFVAEKFRIVAAEATTGYPAVTVKVGTGTGEINSSSGKVPATIAVGDIANNAITAAAIADAAIDAATFAAGAIDAAAIATDAIGSAELASSAISEIQSGLSTLDAAAVRTALGLASANLDTQLSAIAGYIDTEVGSIISELAKVPKSDSNVTLNATVLAAIADALLNRDMSTGTDSGSTTVRTMRQALRAIRNKWSISGGTMTVCKEDDSTTSWTSALTGTAGADPITTSDPAGP